MKLQLEATHPLHDLQHEYDRLLGSAICSYSDRLLALPSYRDKRYCLFYPSSGVSKGPVKVMLVGQATNGWKPEFDPRTCDPVALVDEARLWSNSTDEGERTPLDWVNKQWGTGSRQSRSFFWQVGYKVINELCGHDTYSEEWCHNAVWSNLMKITPLKWNPDDTERAAHEPEAIELFRLEVSMIQPEYVILLTNWETWAKPFLEGWATPGPLTRESEGRIQWIGDHGNSRLIVTKRPHQTSGDYASAPYVEAIMNAVK